MDDLIRLGLSNAVAATLLAGMALIAGRAVRRPALTHALWLLVLIKLITPPLRCIEFEWPPSPQPALPNTPPGPPMLADARQVEADAMPEGDDFVPMFEATPDSVDAPAAEPIVNHALAGTQGDSSADMPWVLLLSVGWLTGSAGWFTLAAWRTWRFHRLLAHAEPAPNALQAETKRLARQLGLASCPGVWLVPGRIAPMVWALGGKPRILLPARLLPGLEAEQRAALLLHELAHLRRGDHWTRVLEIGTTCLYWWHPIVWLARRELREAEEQCCDAWVVWAQPGSPRGYALALVATLDFLSQARSVLPAVASGMGRTHDLRRRLTMIMRGTTPRQLSWRGVLAVGAAAVALLPLVPTLARSQQPPAAGDQPGNARAQERRARAEEERTQAQMRKAEADLQQARAQLEQAERRLQERRAQLQNQPGKPGEDRDASPRPRDGQRRRFTIIIQDENGRELRRIEARPGQQIRVPGGDGPNEWGRVPDQPGRGGPGKITDTPGRPGAGPAGPRMQPPSGRKPGDPAGMIPGGGGPPGGSDQERRLQDVERRLNDIMRLLEQMRRDMEQRGRRDRRSETPRPEPQPRPGRNGPLVPDGEIIKPTTPAPEDRPTPRRQRNSGNPAGLTPAPPAPAVAPAPPANAAPGIAPARPADPAPGVAPAPARPKALAASP